MPTTTFAIAWPRSRNGQVHVDDVRLIITDAPDDLTRAEVLAFGGSDDSFDHVIPEDEWSAGVQLSAKNAPRVQWRGRAGRPRIGSPINIRLDDDLLARLDAEAERAGESRAATARRLLSAALGD